jgi:hypothetical protein
MKEMTYRTKVHVRKELLHQIVDVAAYIRRHPEMIQCANKLLFGTSKAVH